MHTYTNATHTNTHTLPCTYRLAVHTSLGCGFTDMDVGPTAATPDISCHSLTFSVHEGGERGWGVGDSHLKGATSYRIYLIN